MVKMTYYYLKQKVSLGDIIDFKGLKVEVTDNLIKSNPDLFIVEEELLPEYWERVINTSGFTKGKIYKIKDRTNLEKWGNFIDDRGQTNGSAPENYKHFKPSTPEAFQRQELLEEAKRRYPVGTRFKSAFNNAYKGEVSTTNFYWWFATDIVVDTCGGKSVYSKGAWAEIIKPIFKSEDGVDIYESDSVWYIYKGNMSNPIFTTANPQILSSYNVVIFSTKEAAEDWLAKNKPKDLQYYEDLLLNPVEAYRDYTFCAFSFSHYTWLKNKEPKLYWLKILELVQQDLDDGWKADLVGSYPNKWFIHSFRGKIGIDATDILNRGQQMFKTRQSAQKAIELMGDKLDIIFK